jgi:hypothetical protein
MRWPWVISVVLGKKNVAYHWLGPVDKSYGSTLYQIDERFVASLRRTEAPEKGRRRRPIA